MQIGLCALAPDSVKSLHIPWYHIVPCMVACCLPACEGIEQVAIHCDCVSLSDVLVARCCHAAGLTTDSMMFGTLGQAPNLTAPVQ